MLTEGLRALESLENGWILISLLNEFAEIEHLGPTVASRLRREGSSMGAGAVIEWACGGAAAQTDKAALRA